MATCPNKSLPEWGQLVDSVGTHRAFFLWDKYDGNVPTRYYTVRKAEENNDTADRVRAVAQKMGVKIATLEEYAKANPEINVNNVNGVTDLLTNTIAIAEGRGEAILTQEVVHFATAILEQTKPEIVTGLIKEIGKYQIYKDTFNAYKNSEYYQDSNGKPDIRKIKKEAVDKLIAQVIVSNNEGAPDALFPELKYADSMSWIERVWEDIKQMIRSIYGKSDISLFNTTANTILKGEVGGTAEVITENDIYFDLSSNQAVNDMYDTINAIDNDMVLIAEVRDADNNITKKRHYKYKDVEISQSVTEKINKNKSFANLVDAPEKMQWGSVSHKYIEDYIKNNLIDSNGFARSTFGNANIDTSLNANIQATLQNFAKELIASYPQGTRFMLEKKVVNTQVKGGLAGTVDFMALIPSVDKNGMTSVEVDVLDWKFTSVNTSQYEDLSPGKQKAWKMQMGEYVNMLKQKNYGIKQEQFRKTRMIPLISNYRYKVPGVPFSGLVLNTVEVAGLRAPKDTKLYLLPVPIDSESTGVESVDKLVRALESQKKKLYKILVDPAQQFTKNQQLTELGNAIRQLRVQMNFQPLYIVGKNFTEKIGEALKGYKNLDIDSMSDLERDEWAGQLLEYEKSLDKFVELRNVFNDSVSGQELTPEENKTQRMIERVSIDAEKLLEGIRAARDKFIISLALDAGVVRETNREDVLAPERAISNFSYSMLEGSRLPAKIIKMASNMILTSRNLVDIITNRRIAAYEPKLLALEEEARRRGVKAFDLIGKVRENDLVLIKKIKASFWEDKKSAAAAKNKKFFKDNVNEAALKKEIKQILDDSFARIDSTVFTLDTTENKNRQTLKKNSLRNQLDIYSETFTGWNEPFFNAIYNKHIKEELHYSDEYNTMRQNKAALDVWEFFTELNKEARDMGYLEKQNSSFFPLIEATMLQKLQQTKNIPGQSLDFLKDMYTSRINETFDYGNIDPETGELKRSIPKYFVKTDKNVEQLSRDLNQVGAMWIEAVEKYRSSKELENTLNNMLEAEKAKGMLVVDGNKTVYVDGRPLTKEDNTNASILQTIIDDGIYGIRESNSDLGIFGAPTRAVETIAEKAGTQDEESKRRRGVNTKKAINNSNNIVRLLGLGAKIPISLANTIGTNLQSIIKSGKFYSAKEYETNLAKVTLSDLGTLTTVQKGILDLFVPLNEDIPLERRRAMAKKQGFLKYLSTWSFTDTLMLTMQFPEKKLQFANALSYLDNTMVVDGKLVNIRQYLREQDRAARKDLNFEQRKALEKSFKDRVKKLKETKSLNQIAKIENGDVVIPEVSDKEIAKYRTQIIDYNRMLNGMMDNNDKMGFRRDTMFSSFMMFKSWIPKLVYVRAGDLERNLQTNEWNYGRARAMLKTLAYSDLEKQNLSQLQTQSFVRRMQTATFGRIQNLRDVMQGTDRGLEILNNMLYDKKMAYFKKTGQELEITEEEFQDLVRQLITEQWRELAVLLTVTSAVIGVVAAEPPEDASPLEKNRYKWLLKTSNKIADEITFYYLPGSAESITSGSFLPALSLLSRTSRFFDQLVKEAYGSYKGDEDLVRDTHPTKYLFNLFPGLSQFQNEYLPYIYPEIAKDLGVRVTTQSRKN